MRLHGAVVEFEAKAIAEDGSFVGYASTFGNEGLGRDVMMAGAFVKSLARRPAGKVKMLRGHDTAEPIGIWTDLVEDRKGLLAKGQLILETVKGRETHALLKAGALDALSVGYRTLKDHFDRTKGVRFLDEVDLFEISVVTFPMNPRAGISAVKGDPDRAAALVRAIDRATAALRV